MKSRYEKFIKLVRNWSLITGVGGWGCGALQNGKGGNTCEVLPLRKGGGAGKKIRHAKRGHNMFWGSFYVVA